MRHHIMLNASLLNLVASVEVETSVHQVVLLLSHLIIISLRLRHLSVNVAFFICITERCEQLGVELMSRST